MSVLAATPWPRNGRHRATDVTDFLTRYRAGLASALVSVDLQTLGDVIAILDRARAEARSIFVCGNGGSSSTASHFACDMLKGASFGHPVRFRIVSLCDSLPTLTAYSNDVGYEWIFAEQLKNFAHPEDVVVAISGSGNSPNVLRAIEYGNSIGCHTIAFTGGDGGKLGPLASVNVQVSHSHMGRIEDVHMMLLHMISYCFMEAGTTPEAHELAMNASKSW